ncbi:MAG: hypothetical protein V4508_17540 [Pseudomonadota bacterium]
MTPDRSHQQSQTVEHRLTRLEASAEVLQRDMTELKTEVKGIRTTDFRLIFGAMITLALGMASLMAKGFHWI